MVLFDDVRQFVQSGVGKEVVGGVCLYVCIYYYISLTNLCVCLFCYGT